MPCNLQPAIAGLSDVMKWGVSEVLERHDEKEELWWYITQMDKGIAPLKMNHDEVKKSGYGKWIHMKPVVKDKQ